MNESLMALFLKEQQEQFALVTLYLKSKKSEKAKSEKSKGRKSKE